MKSRTFGRASLVRETLVFSQNRVLAGRDVNRQREVRLRAASCELRAATLAAKRDVHDVLRQLGEQLERAGRLGERPRLSSMK